MTHPGTETTPGWRQARGKTRLAVMLTVGVAVAVVTGVLGQWPYAPVAGWDAAALVLSVWVWTVIATMNPADTKTHATREDPSRAVSDTIVILAAIASLAAVGVVLIHAANAKGAAQGLLAGFGVASIALSWPITSASACCSSSLTS